MLVFFVILGLVGLGTLVVSFALSWYAKPNSWADIIASWVFWPATLSFATGAATTCYMVGV